VLKTSAKCDTFVVFRMPLAGVKCNRNNGVIHLDVCCISAGICNFLHVVFLCSLHCTFDLQCYLMLCTSHQLVVQNIAISGSVCSHISKTTHPNIIKFSVRVTRYHGSVYLWGSAISYVLPVFLISNRRESKTMHMFCPVRQWRHRGEVCRFRLHLVHLVKLFKLIKKWIMSFLIAHLIASFIL